jgi:hypothetical protein
VNDVLRMMEIGLAKPYVDPTRVVTWGASHGGCITTRVVQSGAPVQAAFEFAGPMDFIKQHAYLKDAAANSADPEVKATSQGLLNLVETACGGPPETAESEYTKRSPVTYSAALAAWPHPFMAAHGVIDTTVPIFNACALASSVGGFESYHVDKNGNESTQSPPGCSAIEWEAGPRPTATWPGDRYLVIYDEMGHGLAGPTGGYLLQDVFGFLKAKMP